MLAKENAMCWLFELSVNEKNSLNISTAEAMRK